MKAIITVEVPEHQIGQEVSVYFKDTMCVKSVCTPLTESDDCVSRETVKALSMPKVIECDDCVSRADALYSICRMCEWYRGTTLICTQKCGSYKRIEKLPSVQPKRDKGEWIEQLSNKEQDEREHIWWKCSQCGQTIFSETERDRKKFHAFCSKCGADMR